MIKLSEHQIQRYYFAWVNEQKEKDERYYMIYAVPNGGKRSARTGAMLKAEGVRKGVYDIHCMVQSHGYGAMLLETKKKGGKLSAEQVVYKARYIKQGYYVAECDCLQDLIYHTLWYFDESKILL